MKWKKAGVATTTVALLSIAACGGGGGSEGDGTGQAGEEPGATPTAKEGGRAGEAIDMSRSQGPAPDIEGAEEGGTLTLLSASGLTTMDPTEAYYTNTYSILSGLVTRSLTQYVYDPEAGNGEGAMVLIPDVAEKWDSNEDYTEWTFTIRDGIRYENGDEVTCEDVAFGIKRSMDRATFPGGAAYSNEFMVNGDKYKGPYKSGEDYEGATCKGNDLILKMETPFPDMPYWGAFPAIGPIPEGDVSNPATYKNHPLATGPYMFDKFEPGISLTLVKNPEWDPKTDPGRHQYVDSWEMKFTEETAKLEQTLLADTGTGQTSLTDESLSASTFREASQEASDRVVLGSTPCTYMFAPDYRTVTDIDVRKAIGYAYPYVDAWKAGGLIVGVTRIPGSELMPPGIPGRVEYDVLGNKGMETDTAKAKQLLQKAGEMGYEIKWPYIKGDELAEAAKDQVVAGLEEAGFKASPVAVGINQYSDFRADPNSPINVRPFGWCSDWPSGGSWFPPLFKSGGSNNYAFFSEKEFDQRIDDILAMPIDEQAAAWGELDKYLFEKYYPGPVVGYAGVAAMHGSRVGGIHNDEVAGEPTWKDLYVISE
jgi:peptide/nickel transport system substrate-binding protein